LYAFNQLEEINIVLCTSGQQYDKSLKFQANVRLVKIEKNTWDVHDTDSRAEAFECLERIQEEMERQKVEHPLWKVPKIRFVYVENR
jgi:hypothetical protein